MVKEPRPGRVKTRLAADMGVIPATWWFRHQTGRLIRRLARDPRWQVTLAVAPDGAVTSRGWPLQVRRQAQHGGSLGDRMRRVFRNAAPGPVVIIGADIPGIRPDMIADAFRALGHHDAVFGPAEDGGYWLIGLARRRAVSRDILQPVRWSSEHALVDSQASLQTRRIGQINSLRDVDRLGDLQALQG